MSALIDAALKELDKLNEDKSFHGGKFIDGDEAYRERLLSHYGYRAGKSGNPQTTLYTHPSGHRVTYDHDTKNWLHEPPQQNQSGSGNNDLARHLKKVHSPKY